MIIIKSDYSPSAAAEQQEEDNTLAIQAVILLAGLPVEKHDQYMTLCQKAADAYLAELEKDPEGWEAAKAATVEPLAQASEILLTHGITIDNVIHEPVTEGYFPHIETTVYRDYASCVVVARIERPVLDEELATYENNRVGYGSEHDEWPIKQEPASKAVH